MITEDQKTQWCTDLRGGNFEQGSFNLKQTRASGNICYCPLGVLAEGLGLFTGKVIDNRVHATKAGVCNLPDDVLPIKYQNEIIQKNDREWLGFPEMADWIEINVPVKEGPE